MEELPSATLLDETLAAARSSNKVVAVRFGRTADALVRRGDAILREASTTLVKANLLLTFTVDLDEVPELTYMYELYDVYTIMLFWRSRPLVIDSGRGATRKITDVNPVGGVALDALLASVVRTALAEGGESPITVRTARARDAQHGDERGDDYPTLNDEAARIADAATDWFHRRAAPVLDRGMEEGLAALQHASEAGRAALETARESARQRVLGWLSFGGEEAETASARQQDATTTDDDQDSAAAPAAAAHLDKHVHEHPDPRPRPEGSSETAGETREK